MSKKTLVLVLIVILSTGAMAYYAFLANKETSTLTYTQKPGTTPLPEKIEKTSLLYFDPLIFSVSNSASRTGEVTIMIDSGKEKISGAQVELSFDPKVLSNVTVLPPSAPNSFFGETDNYLILFNETDDKNGRVSYAVAILPGKEERKGIGALGTLSFTVAGLLSNNSQVSILAKSMVSKKGTQESLLKDASPLIITTATQGAQISQ